MQDILQLPQDLAYIIIGECFRTAWIYLLKVAGSWFFCHPENWLFTNQTFSLVTFQEQLCPWFTNSFNFLSKTYLGVLEILLLYPLSQNIICLTHFPVQGSPIFCIRNLTRSQSSALYMGHGTPNYLHKSVSTRYMCHYSPPGTALKSL